MMTRQNKLTNDKKYLPSDTCIVCEKSLDEVGGERIIVQIPRGIVISDTEYVNSKEGCPRQSYKLSVNQDKYLVVWGEELQTDDVIERAKRKYAKGKQPWFCQVCGKRTCQECGTLIKFPIGSSLLGDKGNSWRVPNLPIDPTCMNPRCKNYKK